MNNVHPKVTAQQDYKFSDSDFQVISAFVKDRFGLDLQLSKKPLVYSRLSKRLRVLGLGCFSDYCELLKGDKTEQEITHLLSALTTNVTHFFREMHHFDYLMENIAPRLVQRAQSGECIRLWSAACSAGQEAYCIAAILLTLEPRIADLDIRILATDIDPKMIAVAKDARYSVEQLQAIPERFRQLMLDAASGPSQIEMSNKLRNIISFAELNLIEKWPMRRKFDVVFCRNAAIYFDRKTQETLWDRFADALLPGGHLMIGHSERLSGRAESQFQSVGITAYSKNPAIQKPGCSERKGKQS